MQTLGENSPSSRVNSCCIIIHWFYGIRRELAERKIICKMLQELVRIVLAAKTSLWTAVDTCIFCWKRFLSYLKIYCCLYNHLQETANPVARQCRRSSETDLDKLTREKKQTLERVLGENQCRHGFTLTRCPWLSGVVGTTTHTHGSVNCNKQRSARHGRCSHKSTFQNTNW